MSKKRYWLKFHENFFNSDEITYLESVENGDKYINIWLKVLLKCLKDGSDRAGLLRFNEKIPYDDKLLARVLRVDIDTIRIAMKYFSQLGMIELLEDGTIYIEEIQKLIGSESESAERVRLHRERKKLLLQCNTDVTDGNDNINTNINTNEEEEIDIPFKEIIEDLNALTDSHYKHTTDSTRKHISARFNEGYTLEDFKTVHQKKYKSWHGTEFENYLRPSTLYGTKFEGYLNEKEINIKDDKSQANKPRFCACGRGLQGGKCPTCDNVKQEYV